MLDSYPKLAIVPLDKLVTHELHDHQRTAPLIAGLKSSGVLKNPPIISPFEDGSDRFMVMDGANRTTALKEMGYPHVLAQIVLPDAAGLEVQSWNHVIWGLPTESFLEKVNAIESIEVRSYKDPKEALRLLWNQEILLYIQVPDGAVYIATTTQKALEDQVKVLHLVMDVYRQIAHLDRTRVRTIDSLLGLYSELTALLVYPPFNIHEVLDICARGKLFPSGVTRFIIAMRALRVNYPLDALASSDSLSDKNQHLQDWLKLKMNKKGVRVYVEPTVLYDE